MIIRLILLFAFFNICQSVVAQQIENYYIIIEQIPFVAKYSNTKSELHHVLIDSVPHRQNVISRVFSINPHKIYKKDNRRYAVWNIDSHVKALDIKVTTEIELLDFDLQTIQNSGKIDVDTSSKNIYLEKDKFLEISNKKIKETAYQLQTKNELETIKAIFKYVTDNLEYKNFPNQARGAKRALKTGLGDCTEYSELLIALCRVLKIPARYAVGYTIKNRNDVGFHNWAEVYSSEYGWIPLDATWADSKHGTTTFENLTNRLIYLGNTRGIRRTRVVTRDDILYQEVVRTQGSLFNVAVALYNNNNLAEAIFYFDMLIVDNQNNYQYFNFKGMALARLGKFDEALANLQHALRLCSLAEENLMIYSMSNFFALKGDKEKCLSYLKAAFDAGFTNIDYVKTDPDFEDYKNDKDFIKLLENN